MKVYRIKHKPSGLYISDHTPYATSMSFQGQIFPKSNILYIAFENNPDYEILYDEIKD